MTENFWEDVMNCLLGVILYHGDLPDEDTWCNQYQYEVENMIEDIKNFHKSNNEAGLEISNEAMSKFLVYTEWMHIGNDRLVKKCAIDKEQLLFISAKILDELN